MPDSQVVRHSSVAGMFYPGEAGELERDVDDLLRAVPPERSERPIVAVIAPHAGYVYSGGTAARAYARLKGASYDTVVVVSPSHREYFDGASVYPGDAYATPLGDVPIDGSLRDMLARSCRHVSVSLQGHRSEHAVEVQLPFLQRVLGSFRLLPVVIGNQQRSVCFELGECLGKLLKGRSALLVASTDLSHYHTAREAGILDGAFVRLLERGDDEGIMSALEERSTEACGGGPVVAVLHAVRTMGSAAVKVVGRSTSGDVNGDTRSVVGYVSAIAYV
jgi:MEMO1 family protein